MKSYVWHEKLKDIQKRELGWLKGGDKEIDS